MFDIDVGLSIYLDWYLAANQLKMIMYRCLKVSYPGWLLSFHDALVVPSVTDIIYAFI
jgi:hypothetical protein